MYRKTLSLIFFRAENIQSCVFSDGVMQNLELEAVLLLASGLLHSRETLRLSFIGRNRSTCVILYLFIGTHA